jgi:16S rRNA (adenine1518-N6/adenine1519-N6)-dimethyltransferase
VNKGLRTEAALPPDGLPPIGEVIRNLRLVAHKGLGQNFIRDLNLTRRIARAAGPLQGVAVVEVGPGPGGLTRALFLEGAERVIALERDARCRPALEAIAARYPGRLEVLYGDALHGNWQQIAERAVDGPAIAANLPYNIATVLLTRWLETEPWPPWYRRMTLMFQREVAERIVAAPGTKAYGRLAVLAQWRTIPRLLFTIKPEAFTPAPSVASALVAFLPLPEPTPDCRSATLARVTAAAFGQRRKMLRQSLKAFVPRPEALLAAAGMAETLRADEVPVEGFARLAFLAERMATPG